MYYYICDDFSWVWCLCALPGPLRPNLCDQCGQSNKSANRTGWKIQHKLISDWIKQVNINVKHLDGPLHPIEHVYPMLKTTLFMNSTNVKYSVKVMPETDAENVRLSCSLLSDIKPHISGRKYTFRPICRNLTLRALEKVDNKLKLLSAAVHRLLQLECLRCLLVFVTAKLSIDKLSEFQMPLNSETYQYPCLSTLFLLS